MVIIILLQAVARALQDEIDRLERDKQLALEAQDRELAKMIHEKERARYRRAKEKARLKAEAMAAANGGAVIPTDQIGEIPEGSEAGVAMMVRASSRNSSSSERSSRSSELLPPKIPDKQPKSPTGDQIGFRANPKPLPPHPPMQDFDSISPPPPIRLEHHRRLPVDPVPPYMPIHGYNRNSPKRNK